MKGIARQVSEVNRNIPFVLNVISKNQNGGKASTILQDLIVRSSNLREVVEETKSSLSGVQCVDSLFRQPQLVPGLAKYKTFFHFAVNRNPSQRIG